MRRAFAGMSLSDLDPFVHMDQMGEVDYAPGEPKGTPWHPHRGFETVTYMIDGTFAHQDSQRRRRPHHQRGHPVDDRRRRHPAHRDAPGGPGGGGRAVPRHPALGEPAGQGQDDPTGVPGARGRRRDAAVLARTEGPSCGSSPARSVDTPAPDRRIRRWPSCTPPSLPVPSCDCPGTPRSTPWSTSWPDPVGSAPPANRSGRPAGLVRRRRLDHRAGR